MNEKQSRQLRIMCQNAQKEIQKIYDKIIEYEIGDKK